MPSQADPIARLRRRMVATCVMGGVAVLCTVLWALSPPPLIVTGDAGPRLLAESESSDVVQGVDVLDTGSFDVRLWNPLVQRPEDTPLRAAPASASRPFRLRLVGITRENGELYAALYDPDQDKLLVVRNGDSVARYRVKGVTLAGVTLSEGNAQRELLLQAKERR